jgi:transcriptional regulator with XRE-family HTH domain
MSTKKPYTLKDLERDMGPLTFGQALWAHRKCEEISLKDFAKKLGISSQSLCDIEKGRRIPSVHRVVKIAAKIKEPADTWLALALEDMVRSVNANLTVEVKKKIS